MNDVVDALLETSSLVDLTADPQATFAQRDVVQVEGSVSLSPVTEIGALMGTLLPLFLDQVALGGSFENVDPSVLGKVFLSQGSGATDFPHVYEVDAGPPLPAVVFVASPSHLFGSAGLRGAL